LLPVVAFINDFDREADRLRRVEKPDDGEMALEEVGDAADLRLRSVSRLHLVQDLLRR
jgi:hypothetical protein